MDVSDREGLPRVRVGGEERVTPLELFFDLVFVFAFTQVAGFLSDHLTWLGMLQAAALLVALWTIWGVLVADQRRAGRGGDPSAAVDLHRDGGHVRSLAGCTSRSNPTGVTGQLLTWGLRKYPHGNRGFGRTK